MCGWVAWNWYGRRKPDRSFRRDFALRRFRPGPPGVGGRFGQHLGFPSRRICHAGRAVRGKVATSPYRQKTAFHDCVKKTHTIRSVRGMSKYRASAAHHGIHRSRRAMPCPGRFRGRWHHGGRRLSRAGFPLDPISSRRSRWCRPHAGASDHERARLPSLCAASSKKRDEVADPRPLASRAELVPRGDFAEDAGMALLGPLTLRRPVGLVTVAARAGHRRCRSTRA